MLGTATSRLLLLAVAAVAIAVACPAAVLAAGPAVAPLSPYPVAAPTPVGDSVLPLFVDDDELVRAQLKRDGSIGSMADDLKIKINGGGDYALHLPGRVSAVADLGGDSVPGLSDGRVSFLGHLDAGQKLLAAEATLDPALHAADIPLHLAISYQDGGSAGSGRKSYTETIEIDNVTGQPATFIRGTPDPVALAQALDALHGVPVVYTPEINLATLYPIPAKLTLRAPISSVARQAYVPLAVDARIHLESADRLVTAVGADVAVDARGTQLHWVARLPQDTTSDGKLTVSFTFTGPAPLREPSVDIRAQVLPLPAALFAPPAGTTWTQAVRTSHSLADLAVLAQSGALSLHRIQDVSPPVGRPGGGPERVSYELVLASGQAPKPRAVAEAPLHPHPWAIALAALAATFVAVNAYWAWSRH
ncbi:MAG TPA: hypothetical protein VNV65_06050 [Candidatus Solibacter sp.]|jgi:hypothetical protein|nr:hypothetical protein [Candidatus Solibacter sp.]